MASKELAERVMEVTKADSLIDSILSQVISQARVTLADIPRKESDRMIDAIRDVMVQHKKPLRDIAVAGFISTFTEEEAQATVDFYETEIGSSIVDKQQIAATKNFKESFGYNQAVIAPAIDAAVLKVIEELKAEEQAEADQKKGSE